ncbi:MAG: DUF58 domain-containing protein [Dehalococcoidia bacterium]
MTNLRSWAILFSLRLYVAVALVMAVPFSPLALSFVPVVLLFAYFYLWRWPLSVTVNLLRDYFLFFALALLFEPVVGGLFSPIVSLPVLVLINHGLQETAGSLSLRDIKYERGPTGIFITIALVSILTLGVSVLLGSLSLLLASVAVIIYFGVLAAVVIRRFPIKSVEAIQVQQRMVAGAKDHLQVRLIRRTKMGGLLFLKSEDDWLKVSPPVLSLKEPQFAIDVTLSPPLSGPSIVKLQAHAIDRWGLIQTRFELEPINLFVIPRAKYAEWLAKKYLAESQPGVLPLVSSRETRKLILGSRRGVEYSGNRMYQPGDSLKSINWKHSVKYNEMIIKEFAEFQGQSAILLINLAIADAEQADKLAYEIIVTAISLAREDIPTALAAYDHEGVRLTTLTLQPRQLLLQSLQVVRKMVVFANPVKYLDPPDVVRLRANISRIQSARSEASIVLTQLLQLEYGNLENNARLNPATKALSEALSKAGQRCNVLIISHRNHDAEALAFNTFNFARKGNTVLTLLNG